MNFKNLLLSGLLIMFVTVAQAEDDHWMDVISVIDHNERLIELTTIGSNLKASTNSVVINLYNEATAALQAAKDAYNLGNYVEARSLSLKSIRIVYEADNALNNLSE